MKSVHRSWFASCCQRSIRLFVLLLGIGSYAYSQLSTVYVDATNGSDSYTGANAANTPLGTGPKATIHAGLNALSDRGRLIIFAGTYAGDGVDTDGSPTINLDNADIDINTSKYPRLLTGLTIELRSLAGSNEIKIAADANTVRAPNGALINHTADQYIPNFIFNIPGGVLTITTTSGTEFLSLAAVRSDGTVIAGLTLSSGSIDILKGSSFHLHNGATITINGSARFLHDAPQKDLDLNLVYRGGETFTAGAEAGYATFGSGSLIVNKDSGSTITFPSPMAFSGNNDGVVIQSGNATFNSALSLGTIGATGQSPRTSDLVASTSGIVNFSAPVTLVVASGSIADSSMSTIDNVGRGTLYFQQGVTWAASYNSSATSFPLSESTALVWNAAAGSITFAGGVKLTHESTTVNAGAVTVEAGIQNNGTGRITFAGPVSVDPRIESSAGATQQFSVTAVNNAGGTLDISGSLRSGLVNAAGSLIGGTININGPTVLGSVGNASGILRNSPNKLINLGANTLTLNGNTDLSLKGSTITSSTGAIVVKATGIVTIDGGNLPNFLIDQQSGGTTLFAGIVSVSTLTVSSGLCSIQAPLSVNGSLIVNGGSFVQQSTTNILGSATVAGGTWLVQASTSVAGTLSITSGSCTVSDNVGVSLSATDFLLTNGIINLGGSIGGQLRLRGDFRRSGGTVNAGTASLVVLLGSNPETFDPGPGLQMCALEIDNASGGVRLLQSFRVSGNFTIGAGASVDFGSSSILINGDGGVFSNNGSFTATGAGLILGGATSVTGGLAVTRSEIRAGLGSSFSSLTIDVGNGNTCSLRGPAAVSWNGTLSLLSGGLDVASAIDLAPLGPASSIVRDIVKSNGISVSAGTFNTHGIRHSLRLIGNLSSDASMTADVISDLPAADSLIIDINSGIIEDSNDTGIVDAHYLLLPANLFIYGGALTVGSRSAVELAANGKGGNVLELSGTNVRHSIRGILRTAESGDSILVSGGSVTVVGAQQPGDAALIGNFGIGVSGSCTISGVCGFLGNFSVASRSVVSLNMGAVASDQRIRGSMSLNGENFTLAGNVEVMGGIAFNSGVLNLGAYNLQLTTSGDFVQGAGAVGYTTTGGYLVMNRSGAGLRIGNLESNGLPNLQLLSNAFLVAPGRVTKSLLIGSALSNGIPVLTLGNLGNDLVFTGSTISLLSNGSGNKSAIVSNGTTDGTPGGKLYVASTSTTVFLNNDFSIEELIFNPPAIDGSFSLISTDLAPHVLTITDILTHAGGQINLGIDHLAFTGTGILPGYRPYNRSDGTMSAQTGEMRFVGKAPQQFSCGAGFAIPNLRLWNPKGVTKSFGSEPLIVTRTLDLSDGPFTFEVGTMIVENGATVVRRRSSAVTSSPLVYRNSINISYLVDADNGNFSTGTELPFETGILKNLTVGNANTSSDSSYVTIDKNVVVGGTLFLVGGHLDWGLYKVTVPDGGTIDIAGGNVRSASGATGGLELSRYNLIYRKSAFVTPTSLEFPAGTGVTISSLSVVASSDSTPTVLYVYSNRTVGSLYLNARQGGIEFGAPGSFVARNLTVRESLTVVNGGFTNTSGTNAILNLAGTNPQVITLPDSGLTMQGGASAVHLQLNNGAGFILRGGNLSFGAGSVLLFVNGVFRTNGRTVTLAHTATGQGFDRQGVVGTNASHIYGIVSQSITGGAGNFSEYPNGRFEFPTGTLTDYRPFVITFTNDYPAKTPGTISAALIDQFPGGTTGLPLDGGSGIRTLSYPPFYWLVSASSGSFGDDQSFDLETSIKNPVFRYTGASTLRLIRRQGDPPTSAWKLLGTASGYGSSSVTVTPSKDTTVTIRSVSTGGGLAGTNIVTVGLAINRKPVISARTPSGLSNISYTSPTTFGISVTDPDGDPVTVTWKVGGAVLQSGSDTSFSYVLRRTDSVVTAVFADPFGAADSTLWNAVVVDVSEETNGVPTEFGLGQNYPNPFNPSTVITYQLSAASFVTLKVFDALGREIETLVDEKQGAGRYTVRWNASNQPSGMYVYRIHAVEATSGGAKNHLETRKMMLLK
jgi:hypothetical protein